MEYKNKHSQNSSDEMKNNQLDNRNEVANYNEIDDDCGKINIRSLKARKRITYILKGFMFILVAVVSGGVSGAYIAKKLYTEEPYVRYSPQIFEKVGVNNQNSEIPKNSITQIAQMVSPAIVGISNNAKRFSKEIDGSGGSGVIFRSDGYIVTNYHIIQNESNILVKLPNSRMFPAKLIGEDKASDLAVLKIDAENLPVARFGDSSKVDVGDITIAIGNPLGEEFAGTVSSGIVSAVNSQLETCDPDSRGIAKYKLIQTDAVINSSNTGGALFNELGEVIGINSLQFESSDRMGCAISINEAAKIIESLMKYGKIITFNSGISGKIVILNDKSLKGVYVQEVEHGSGAEAAGIRPTDIILKLDKLPINKFDDISNIIQKHKVGDSIPCEIWRNGKTMEVKINLGE